MASSIEELSQWYKDGDSIIQGLDAPGDTSLFHWPTDFHYITRDYGARPDVYKGKIPRRLYHPSHWHDGHEGVDIRTGREGNVLSIADGEVYEVGQRSPSHAYGIAIRIQHEIKIDGKLQKIRSVYAHLSKPFVKKGFDVGDGMIIGVAGSTGNSTGDHLHLTLYWWFDSLQSYRIVNPMWVLGL